MTTPGDVASTTVWFPPGKWVDFFTGATFEGPTTATLAVPLDRMPVFVRQGGIVPEEPSSGERSHPMRSRLSSIRDRQGPSSSTAMLERALATPRASAPRPV